MGEKLKQMGSDDAACDFGRYLASCRKAKGISLETVSQQTKITTTCLRQIENEDLRHLPPAVLVRGFLKAYAAVVDGDAQEALRRYEAKCADQAREERNLAQLGAVPKFWPRFLIFIVLFSALVGGTIYMGKRIYGPASHSQPELPMESDPVPSTEKGAEEVRASDSKTVETAPKASLAAPERSVSQTVPAKTTVASDPATTATEPMVPKSALGLQIRAVEPTWLKIIADGQKPQEFNLRPNDEVTLEAKTQFNLLIGNAGGIRLMLNDKPVDIPGKSGQVVTLILP